MAGPRAGLTPRRQRSGERDTTGGIIKAGDVGLRCALCQAPLMLCIVVDQSRPARVGRSIGVDRFALPMLDNFVAAVSDCAIFGQNVALAAELARYDAAFAAAEVAQGRPSGGWQARHRDRFASDRYLAGRDKLRAVLGRLGFPLT